MKTILTSLVIAFAIQLSFGQTDVIALKSHSGTLDQLDSKEGNFGLPPREVDSIIYIGQGCIVEVSHHFQPYYERDTMCDNYLMKEYDYDVTELKKMYPAHVKFVNFEMREKEQKQERKRRPFKNSIPFILAGLLVGGAGIYRQRNKK